MVVACPQPCINLGYLPYVSALAEQGREYSSRIATATISSNRIAARPPHCRAAVAACVGLASHRSPTPRFPDGEATGYAYHRYPGSKVSTKFSTT